jgi:serine/threonine protein phosphatase 1
MRQFAIADIHGHLKTLKALLAGINFTVFDELFLLGDFIDRGPDSKGVIDYIEELKKEGYAVHCLRGNHEQMCLDAATQPEMFRLWLKHGGRATKDSFSGHEVTVPARYREWMEALPLYLETEGYLFVHAGVDCSEPDPLADPGGLLWARGWTDSLDHEWLGDRIIVHGHTPVGRDIIELNARYLANMPVLNIDCGCFAKSRSGMGQLCAVELGSYALTFQRNIG